MNVTRLLPLNAVIWIIALAGCAMPPTLTPSQLNSAVDQYDGKEVRVQGWLIHRFENIGIWDSENAYASRMEVDTQNPSPEWPGWPSSCISYDGRELGSQFGARNVTLLGIFRKNILPPNAISNGICNTSGLEVTWMSQ
jgi:hypothetical protein